jgi:uroporphyrin-III C-methyltransferase
VLETTLGAAGSLGEVPTPAIVVLGPASAMRAALDWYAPALRDNPFG